MPGFDNKIVFASNVDFTGNSLTQGTPQIANNGQLLIGSATGPNGACLNAGVLTSPSGTVTIGYSAPNITLDVTPGSVGIVTIQGDTGSVTGATVKFTGGATGLTFGGVSPTMTLAGTLVVAHGGTGAVTLTGVLTGNGTSAVTASTVTQHGVLVGGASNAVSSTSVGSTGQVLQANTGADPTYSTATYPSVGTSTGSILRADGTNWAATTSTYPNTNAVNTLLYASASNVMSALATVNSASLTTNSSGVPTWISAGTSWTPALNFGGASTGITYGTQTGAYVKLGPVVFYKFVIVLTSKGSASGNATLAGWPFIAVSSDSYNLLTGYASMTLASIAYLQVLPNSSTNVFILSSGSTSGVETAITDANFTNTTTLQGYGFYFTA